MRASDPARPRSIRLKIERSAVVGSSGQVAPDGLGSPVTSQAVRWSNASASDVEGVAPVAARYAQWCRAAQARISGLIALLVVYQGRVLPVS